VALHQTILGWDVLLLETDIAHRSKQSMQSIPATFRDVTHYRQVMQPLLAEECRACLVNAMAEVAAGQAASKQKDR
jgi:hypothetical protein